MFDFQIDLLLRLVASADDGGKAPEKTVSLQCNRHTKPFFLPFFWTLKGVTPLAGSWFVTHTDTKGVSKRFICNTFAFWRVRDKRTVPKPKRIVFL
jgi:hypothetical protein